MHVAIIMDGNGRWAMRRGLPRAASHRAGVGTVRRIVEHAPDLGIRRMTLYAFSSDNWRRPAQEVQSIFRLMRAYLRLETERLRQRGVRLQIIGRRDRIPKLLLREIERAEFQTSEGKYLHLRIAVDYSSREAIIRTISAVSQRLSQEPLPLADSLQSSCPRHSVRGAKTSIYWSGPAARNGSQISCCGSPPTQNFSLRTVCGQTSIYPTSIQLYRISNGASAVSAAFPPRRTRSGYLVTHPRRSPSVKGYNYTSELSSDE
jgi:undecaprenyl diphosphate synthase